MAVMVGIDEAGYGPILGPLTVSAVTFKIPDNLLKTDHWQVLKKSISKRSQKSAGRLVIADSKKVYKRKSGLGHLQRSVLAALKCLKKTPKTVAELANILSPDCTDRLKNYPWYQDLNLINLENSDVDTAVAAQAFETNLTQNEMSLLDMRSVCFDVGHYNRMVDAMDNKAAVVQTAITQLIAGNFKRHKDDIVQIVVDRQGGRVNYVPWLRQIFPDFELRILRQDEKDSSYELAITGRKMRIHFVVDADEHFLPVSLASLASKYLRELLMHSINRHFIAHCPGLKPTAGYWKDGLRFIEDLKTHRNCPAYDPAQFIRTR